MCSVWNKHLGSVQSTLVTQKIVSWCQLLCLELCNDYSTRAKMRTYTAPRQPHTHIYNQSLRWALIAEPMAITRFEKISARLFLSSSFFRVPPPRIPRCLCKFPAPLHKLCTWQNWIKFNVSHFLPCELHHTEVGMNYTILKLIIVILLYQLFSNIVNFNFNFRGAGNSQRWVGK